MSKLDLIYRVENQDGDGPYQVSHFEDQVLADELRALLEHHNDLSVFPTPCKDEGINRFPDERERCGFNSLAQLLRWFTKDDLDELKKLGFEIKRLKGKITKQGRHQVLFTMS